MNRRIMAKKKIEALTFVALCTAMLCLSSYLVIPIPMSPAVLSLQTVTVNLIALCLKPKQTLYSTGLYLLMGIIGLPVFSGGTAGLSKLISPVGGYYFGFVISAFLMSLLKGKKADFKKFCALTIFVGLPIEHLCAIIMMCIIGNVGLLTAFESISLPFLPGDIIKCFASAAIAVPLCKAVSKSSQ